MSHATTNYTSSLSCLYSVGFLCQLLFDINCFILEYIINCISKCLQILSVICFYFHSLFIVFVLLFFLYHFGEWRCIYRSATVYRWASRVVCWCDCSSDDVGLCLRHRTPVALASCAISDEFTGRLCTEFGRGSALAAGGQSRHRTAALRPVTFPFARRRWRSLKHFSCPTRRRRSNTSRTADTSSTMSPIIPVIVVVWPRTA